MLHSLAIATNNNNQPLSMPKIDYSLGTSGTSVELLMKPVHASSC